MDRLAPVGGVEKEALCESGVPNEKPNLEPSLVHDRYSLLEKRY